MAIDYTKVLDAFYARVAEGELTGPLSELSDAIDTWLMEANEEALKGLLRTADPERLGLHGIRAIVADTRQPGPWSSARAAFLTQAHAFVRRHYPERAERLIARNEESLIRYLLQLQGPPIKQPASNLPTASQE